MRAQIILTPSESKKLIAKAVARMDVVTRAAAKGKVILHPSSSTFFIVEELLGSRPNTEAWVCGVISPKGACAEVGVLLGHPALASEDAKKSAMLNPDAFPHSWVIQGKKLSSGIPLGDILESLGPDDVCIKGVNAIDAEGNVGALIANLTEAGTIGRVMVAAKKKGFSVIFPVGLEKFIPGSIKAAAQEARKGNYEYGMGLSCWLYPCKGLAVTEVKAMEILAGVNAVPIAAGGLGGAEGAVTMVLSGSDEQISRAVEHVEASKGARLPDFRTPNCYACSVKACKFPIRNKPWG